MHKSPASVVFTLVSMGGKPLHSTVSFIFQNKVGKGKYLHFYLTAIVQKEQYILKTAFLEPVFKVKSLSYNARGKVERAWLGSASNEVPSLNTNKLHLH